MKYMRFALFLGVIFSSGYVDAMRSIQKTSQNSNTTRLDQSVMNKSRITPISFSAQQNLENRSNRPLKMEENQHLLNRSQFGKQIQQEQVQQEIQQDLGVSVNDDEGNYQNAADQLFVEQGNNKLLQRQPKKVVKPLHFVPSSNVVQEGDDDEGLLKILNSQQKGSHNQDHHASHDPRSQLANKQNVDDLVHSQVKKQVQTISENIVDEKIADLVSGLEYLKGLINTNVSGDDNLSANDYLSQILEVINDIRKEKIDSSNKIIEEAIFRSVENSQKLSVQVIGLLTANEELKYNKSLLDADVKYYKSVIDANKQDKGNGDSKIMESLLEQNKSLKEQVENLRKAANTDAKTINGNIQHSANLREKITLLEKNNNELMNKLTQLCNAIKSSSDLGLASAFGDIVSGVSEFSGYNGELSSAYDKAVRDLQDQKAALEVQIERNRIAQLDLDSRFYDEIKGFRARTQSAYETAIHALNEARDKHAKLLHLLGSSSIQVTDELLIETGDIPSYEDVIAQGNNKRNESKMSQSGLSKSYMNPIKNFKNKKNQALKEQEEN